MLDGIQKRFHGLAGKRTAAGIGDGARNHDGNPGALCLENRQHRVNRGLAVKRIEHRFDHQEVNPAFDKAERGLGIGGFQLVERYGAVPG